MAEHGQPQTDTTPLSGAKIPGGVGGPTQVASLPPFPLPLPAVACLPSSLPRLRIPTSKLWTNTLWDLGEWRISCRRVSMWPPRSTRFPSCPVPEASGRPFIGPRRFRPPSSRRLVVGGGGGACATQGTWSVPSGGRCGGIPEPYNCLSYAWGPGRTHPKRDGNPSPGCNPSGTSPPSLTGSCSTSSRPGTMSAGTGGSAPKYPRVPPSPVPP